MTDLRKAAEAVLEAWDWDWSEPRNEALRERMEALRQALAQPEQEPVAWQDPQYKTLIEPHKAHPDWIPLYTAPSKREWVGLTDEDKDELLNLDNWTDIVEAVEAKLKEKNGG